MKIYMARHGESEGNKKNVFYGWTDYPLTDDGCQQAIELGEKLREIEIKTCYTSPLIRASETARLCMMGRDIPMIFTSDLREQYMGELEDTSVEENLAKNPEIIMAMLKDWTKSAPPGGESFELLAERSSRFLDGIIAADEDALVVAHNGTLAAMFSRLLQAPIGSLDKFWFQHGCYSCVSIVEGRTRLEYFNK